MGASYSPVTHYVLLPLGISFYTFQTLSYSIDLYNGSIKPERNFGYFALYVSFFPQLIAGPIERSSHLVPQLKKAANLNMQDIRYGLNKIALGFFKKLVIADNVGTFVDYVFMDLSVSNGMQVFVALIFFGVQIFCDFSGYTDIAIGSARLMGINLIENFNRPYWVKSFRDFWSRWHMSLTQWIFIYMQFPLLGNKPDNFKRFWVNILVLATIGFWHGASWTFIMFGVFHGLMIGIQGHIEIMRSIPRIENKIYRNAIVPMWNATLICLSTLMFRAQNVEDVWTGYSKIFTDWKWGLGQVTSGFGSGSLFLLIVLLSLLLIPTTFFNRELKFKHNLVYLMVMFVLIIILGEDASQQFIYFQF
jgi:D-alanyl-lipoteichoic acid acyltransferase DltB (MBOAT superfamily)